MDERPLPPEVVLSDPAEPPVPTTELYEYFGTPEGVMEMPESMRAFADEEFDAERAEWAMGRLAEATASLNEKNQQAADWQERIEAWEHRVTQRDQREVRYWKGALTSMLARANARDPKIKSLTLPSGRITSSGPADGNEYVAQLDADHTADLLAWAQDYGWFDDIVKSEPSVAKLRGKIWRCDERGAFVLDPTSSELIEVPGVKVERKARTFDAKPFLT